MGKYRIDRVLGAGSMGVVAAAEHLQLGTEVAIKWLNDAMAANAEAVARFEREARAAARIRGEHVARVIDVGCLDGGAPCMVMELLQGEDLAARIERQGPLAADEAAELVLQACEGVAAAHALGIVHRDLKPENLFCAERADGTVCVKVLDFGISKLPSMSMTRTDSIVGSPHYMSPEQMASSRDVDERTDIWALGVVLHELVAGSVPFPGESFPEVCLRVVQSPPASLLDARPDVPRGLQAVVLKCLEKDRSKRYACVAQLAADLAPFAAAAAGGAPGRSSTRPARRGWAAHVRRTLGPARWRRILAWARSRRGAAVGLGVGALLVVGVAAASLEGGGRAVPGSPREAGGTARAPVLAPRAADLSPTPSRAEAPPREEIGPPSPRPAGALDPALAQPPRANAAPSPRATPVTTSGPVPSRARLYEYRK